MLAPDPHSESSENRRLRAKAQPGPPGIGTRSEDQAEEPLAGAARELGQVDKKDSHLLSTYYKPGTRATVGIHLYQASNGTQSKNTSLGGKRTQGQLGWGPRRASWRKRYLDRDLEDVRRYKKGKEKGEKGHIEIR